MRKGVFGPSQRVGSTRTRHKQHATTVDRGVAAVEFALIFPLLILIVFGTIDFGFLVNRSTMMNNAAREGARVAIFTPDTAAIEARVRDVAENLDQAELTVTVTCRRPDMSPCPGGNFAAEWEPGGTVIVTLDYEHQFLTPIGGFMGLGDTHHLSSAVEMRIEG